MGQLFHLADLDVAADIEQNVFQIVSLHRDLPVGLVEGGIVLYLILLHLAEVGKLHPLTLHAQLVVPEI